MLTKNLEHKAFFKILLRLVLDGIAGLRSFFQGKPREMFAVIRAHFGFYKRLPSALKKRRELKKKLIHSVPDSLIRQELIIFDYFRKKKNTYHELEN